MHLVRSTLLRVVHFSLDVIFVWIPDEESWYVTASFYSVSGYFWRRKQTTAGPLITTILLICYTTAADVSIADRYLAQMWNSLSLCLMCDTEMSFPVFIQHDTVRTVLVHTYCSSAFLLFFFFVCFARMTAGGLLKHDTSLSLCSERKVGPRRITSLTAKASFGHK
jgi:hypothetical protein